MGGGRAIYGIDFSGAKDAGNKIWIAKGVPVGESLLIKECFRARDLPNSGKRVETCLPALVELIKSNQNAVFGFDFPFGLPRTLVHEETWEDFVLAFPGKHKSPEAFREACRQANGGHELKRKTDIEAQTPFSPYNLRLFRQTYYGISDVLFPLVRYSIACILPFQEPVAGKPWILEICPASTLKKHGLYQEYKFPVKKDDRPETRSTILETIEKAGLLKCRDRQIRQSAIADRNGDALDSLIAATVAFDALRDQAAPTRKHKNLYALEGYVFS